MHFSPTLKLGYLKAKKTHGFKSGIMISIYPLDKPSIKKATEQAFFYRFWENPTFSSVGNFLADYLKL